VITRFLPSLVGLTALALLAGPAVGQDKVTFHDRAAKKDLETSGTIQNESPSKIVLRSTTGGATKEIAAGDVIEVVYDVPPAIRLDYRGAIGDERKIEIAKDEERKKVIEDAIGSYQKLVRGLTGDKGKLVARHLAYKVARLRARQAEDDRAAVGPAIAALSKFQKEHPDGWQLLHCCRLLTRLQTEQGDHAAAQKVWDALAATPGVSLETKQEAELQAARSLIRAKRFAEAQQRLQDIQKGVAANDPQATRARIHLAECLGASNKLDEAVRQFEDLIAKTTDPDLKALAYNTLGDCYRYHNRAKDALWPYLWVDVVYHQDRREHQRAVEHLAKLFDELGDKGRAKQYQDKLRAGLK
jgi:tetratricopeptide (TPR) repeat protein